MMPTLAAGDRVLVWCWFVKLRVGEIIAIQDPRDKKILIKRIYAINKGKYDVRGDNKSHSTDSREFGMIDKRRIIGKVIYHVK